MKKVKPQGLPTGSWAMPLFVVSKFHNAADQYVVINPLSEVIRHLLNLYWSNFSNNLNLLIPLTFRWDAVPLGWTRQNRQHWRSGNSSDTQSAETQLQDCLIRGIWPNLLPVFWPIRCASKLGTFCYCNKLPLTQTVRYCVKASVLV